MNLYAAFALFAFIILIYMVIAEVFTILFRFAGLDEEKARFQVVSLLTGAGFTTRESEMILSTRSRRRLARVTMLFGYVFNITFVSALVNIFVSLKLSILGSKVLSLFIPLLAAAAILVLSRVRRIRNWIDRRIEAWAGRLGGQGGQNSILLLDQVGTVTIAQVTLRRMPRELIGKALAETGLKSEHNILVLTVQRPEQPPCQPDAETVFLPGDRLTVFGEYAEICSCFHAKERFTDPD